VQLQTKSSELTYASQQLGCSSAKAERFIESADFENPLGQVTLVILAGNFLEVWVVNPLGVICLGRDGRSEELSEPPGHPEELDKTAASVIRYALLKAFPCSKSTVPLKAVSHSMRSVHD
jgi:hypothetical protein